MKRKLFLIIPVIFIISIISIKLIIENSPKKDKSIEISKVREKHKNFLKNSTYKKNRKLSRKERKAMALPPNSYFEQLWDRTLDPNLGYPNFREALKIQHDLIDTNKNRTIQLRVPGQDADNAWIERGPSNIGGRTRGILFDPNDSSNRRVFAGGVSGGLWVNDDITSANSLWTLVPGVPENISVTQFAVDPNNSNIIYIGAGESYANGDIVGNGVYRSIDGGVNWEMIFGGPDGTSTINATGTQILVDGIFYINDIITRNVDGTTEIYFAAVVQAFSPSGGLPTEFLGINARGVYRSIDNGNTFTLLDINSPQNTGAFPGINPNDIELDVNNNIWIATTSNVGQSPGGEIYRSTDGINFTLVNTIPSAARTEIEPTQNANIFYIAVNRGGADLFITTDAFATIQPLNEPNDADTGIDETDYTRGQAFYDLPIEADPSDDTILYVGGINLFRGIVNQVTRTVSWEQISRWNGGINSNTSIVHADQHAIVFRPGNPNQIVNGTDGGIYYNNNAAGSGNLTTTTQPRNNGYAVTQFYFGDINDVDGTVGGGTQDNGSPFNLTGDASVGVEPFFTVIGGDGAYGQFDDDGDYFIASTQNINYFFINTPITGATNNFGNSAIPTVGATGYQITSRPQNSGEGNFINEADVDTNLDILYINSSIQGGQVRLGVYGNLEGGSTAAITESFLTDPLFVSEPSTLQVSPFTTTSTTLLIGTDSNQLLRVTNADGINADPVFEEITGSNFLGSLSDIEYGINSQTILVTVSNFGVQSIWYTEDNGVTWQAKEGNLPDIPVFTIQQSPLNPNEVIVGTQFGVFRTDNFLDVNPNWQQSFNGMSNVVVRDLDLRPSTNEVLATTFGRGMFVGTFTIDENGDNDNDGILNGVDNCPNTPNPDQADIDNNGIGDVCQDTDGDGVLDINDNCPENLNPGQEDFNNDGIGDVCQDTDNDGVFDDVDNCQENANPDQEDFNNDGIGDACQDTDGDGIFDDVDNCPSTANPGQEDIDNDGIGDACQDTDGDGVLDINDNCPNTANPNQEDRDGNGVGDACEDTDGDGIFDDVDNCPNTPNVDQTDTNGNGLGDACDRSFEAQDNVSIQIISETCPGLDNGVINITTNETFVTYTATIAELNLINAGFNGTTSFTNLPVGSYTVCVSVDDRDFETCFEINIDASPALDIDFDGVLSGTVLNSQLFTFNVEQGTGPFEIRFNNELIRTTNESSIEIELIGSGLLEIIPARLCEGIFELNVENIITDVRAFPNPVIDELTVTVPGDISSVPVNVYNITGQLVYQENSNVIGNRITLPFANISDGVYFVRLEMSNNPVVLKIAKQ